MLHPLQIKNLTLGDGIPKVCIPLVAEDTAALASALATAANAYAESPYDLVEYRADFNRALTDLAGRQPDPASLRALLADVIRQIREGLPPVPLLFTVRTAAEGGEAALSLPAYEALLHAAASLPADIRPELVDLELLTAGVFAAPLTARLQANGVRVVGSSHDFAKTPPREEMLSRLLKMQEAGMDVTKLAVMPQCRQDVLDLLSVTCEMYEGKADRPFVTMSMGSLGLISRLSGSFTGSAITFASAGQASAPGQIGVSDVKRILSVF